MTSPLVTMGAWSQLLKSMPAVEMAVAPVPSVTPTVSHESNSA